MSSDKAQLIRKIAESDLESFIKLIHPGRVLGNFHKELISWWNREDAGKQQLVLLPRDHGKSAMIAYRVAWTIAKCPEIRILYMSATSALAEKQLKFIKDILTSDTFMAYWPEYINKEETKRERWTSSEIAIDHPKRKEEYIRDPTIMTAGLTTSITGLHFDIIVMDDVVVMENAYTSDGRRKVREQVSLITSVAAADSRIWVVGTRYHPKDLYNDLTVMEEDCYDAMGEVIGSLPVYEVYERVVEDKGDGTGNFLWPRQQRKDGKWFGFDKAILARKRAMYLDTTQFRAQYYNNPNDPDNAMIDRSKFQYYNRRHLNRNSGHWAYKENRLNVYAAIDFAYTIGKKNDHSAIVVIGIDPESNIYVLDIVRFQTDKISEYYKNIRDLHVKWDFKKLRAEVTAAQAIIVKDLKDNYIRSEGLVLSIDEHRPTAQSGAKEDRIRAVLQPRYDELKIWHFEGGGCQELEDELVVNHPTHDDIKDAMSCAVEIAVPPKAFKSSSLANQSKNIISFHSRFGGVSVA